MKKYTYFIGVLVVLAFLGVSKAATSGSKPPVVLLEKKNTLTMRSVFTEESVGAVQAQALAISGALGAHQDIYLYMDTPGGSIVAGNHLISTLQGLPQEVKTVTSFSASMGFITTQSLGECLTTPDGVYMSHRAKIGLSGQIPGEVNTMLAFWQNTMTNIETGISSRMGLSLKDYQDLVREEYWVSGADAVKAKVADKVVLVQCAQDLSGSTDTKIQTIFGVITVTYSDCPLISAPLAIAFGALQVTDAELANVKKVVFEVLTNPSSFVGDDNIQKQYYSYVH